MSERIEFMQENSFISLHKNKIVWSTFLGILLLIIFLISKPVLLILALYLTHIALAFIRKTLRLSTVGIELTLFSTVSIGSIAGPVIGAITGFIFIITEYATRKKFSKYMILTIPLYTLIGIIAGGIGHESIIMAGILITVSYAILMFFLSGLIGASKIRMAIFGLTNIAWNTLLFIKIAPLLI